MQTLIRHKIDSTASPRQFVKKSDVIILQADEIPTEVIDKAISRNVTLYLKSIGQLEHKDVYKAELIKSVLAGQPINVNGYTYRILTNERI